MSELVEANPDGAVDSWRRRSAAKVVVMSFVSESVALEAST